MSQELKADMGEVTQTSDDLRNLMGSTEIGTIFVDRSLRVRLFTPRVRDVFELVPADVGRRLLDITTELVDGDLSGEMERVLDRVETIEREVATRNGSSFLMRLLPYRTSDDQIDGVVLTFVDVTERRRAEEVLRYELEATRTVQDLSARLVAETDIALLYQEIIAAAIRLTHADAGTIQMLTPANELVLLATQGFPAGVMKELQVVDARSATRQRAYVDFDDPDVPDVDGSARLHLEAGVRSAQSTPLITRSGSLIGMLSTHWKQSRHRAHERELRHLDLVAREVADLIERHRSEEALRESERRFKAVANLVPDLLWSSDASGSTDWYNDRWLEYTGQAIEEARGYGWAAAVHPDDRNASRARFQQSVDAGQPLHQEHRIRSASGEYRWFLIRTEPLHDANGNIVRWFGAATDVHEQRTLREGLEERVDDRTRELEILSASRQELLDRLLTSVEEERRRIARELHDEMGQHITALRIGLAALPSDATGLAQMKAIIGRLDQTIDRLTLELRPPALDDLGLEGALATLADQYSEGSGLRITAHAFKVDGARFPEAIESTFYRVAQEALTNIWKHASAKTASLILERHSASLRLIIEDDGVGFDGDQAFERRARAGRFGLLGIRERLALIGGTITIESSAGRGTTLYARAPLAE